MYGLLRTASAVVIVLGLNAGAVPSARAAVAYDSFGQWFDAFRNGDHHGPRPGIGRCAERACGGNNNHSFGRTDNAGGNQGRGGTGQQGGGGAGAGGTPGSTSSNTGTGGNPGSTSSNTGTGGNPGSTSSNTGTGGNPGGTGGNTGGGGDRRRR